MNTNTTANFLPMSAFPASSRGHCFSITRAGFLHLPVRFLEQHHFDRFSSVDLFWDPAHHRLALVPLHATSRERVWKLSISPHGGAHIPLRRFCKHFQINIARIAGSYPWEKITIPGQGRAFAIRLDEQQRQPLKGKQP